MKRYLLPAFVVAVGLTLIAWAAQQEDQPHASADRGELMLAVRSDAPASTGGTDGDYSALTTDDIGQARVIQGAPTEGITLVASAAVTETSTGTTAVELSSVGDSLVFQLDVTAAATAVDDTLDVFIQTTVDGTKWTDVVAFTQVLGNGGAKRFLAKISKTEPQAMVENATALSAGSIRQFFGRQYRARYVVVDTDTDDASFTFSITANAG